MKNQEYIDKYFADRLKGYERKPHEEAWQRLEARLERSETKVVPLWWTYTRAASVLLLLGWGTYGGYQYFTASMPDAPVVAAKHTTTPAHSAQQSTQLPASQESPEQTTVANTKPFVLSKNIEKRTNALPSTKQVLVPAPQPQEQVIAKVDVPDKASPKPDNTIVLVVEKSDTPTPETIVLSMVDPQPTTDSPVAQMLEEENTKKTSRLSRIWQQLKRAKKGEGLDWNEIGIKPQKVLARADAKIENTKDNLLESINARNAEK